MSDVLAIAGSPSRTSKSSAILDLSLLRLNALGWQGAALAVRDLSPADLVSANTEGPTIKDALAKVSAARSVIIATPIYKAAYSGILKTFLDLLPQDGLAGKVVLPIATGGSLAHLLAIDYALKPVLYALGAQQILSGIFITDSQLQLDANGQSVLEKATEVRLYDALATLVNALERSNQDWIVVDKTR